MKIEIGDIVLAISGEAQVIAIEERELPGSPLLGVMVRVQWPEGTTMWLDPLSLLPSRATLITRILDALPGLPPREAMCHRGICPQYECSNCERIRLAREAVAMLARRG